MACTCAPGKPMCNSCLQPIEVRNAIAAGPTQNKNGEFTLAQVEVFEKQFKDNIVNDVQGSPIVEAVRKYPDFYDSLSTINNDFLKRPYIVQLLPDYAVLSHRLTKGPLSALEFADFINQSNYTPASAITSANAKGPRFVDELNSYYNGDFADSVLGGFCSIFNSIFGAIDSFFNILESIDSAIQDVFRLLTKIKNIKDEVIAAFEQIKVKALIEAIKNKIAEMIEGAIKKVCQSIANFDVESITGPLPAPTPAQVKIAEQVEEKKSNLQNICGEDNAKKIKDKIQSLIDYAVGLFANPSLEEIMMLISRICAMATGIEGLFKSLKDPLNDFSNRYDEVFNTLSNASNRVTGEAIRGGAIRVPMSERLSQINIARELWEGAGNVPSLTLDEVTGLPSWEEIKDNNHPTFRIEGGWVTNMVPAHEGWTKLDMRVKVYLLRLHAKMIDEGLLNGPLTINSGFRSVAYNRAVDGADQSQHLNGFAADLKWSGFRSTGEDINEFVKLARSVGFKGIGYYNNFIHVDLGPLRSWDRRG